MRSVSTKRLQRPLPISTASLCRCIAGFSLLLLSARSPAWQAVPPSAPSSESGESHRLTPGESQEIPVDLLNHQVVDVDVEQFHGVVLLEWTTPQGDKSPFRFTQDGSHGHIRATIVADQAGAWHLHLAGRNKQPAEYSIRVGAPRLASQQDVARAAAENALAMAEQQRIGLRAKLGNSVTQPDKSRLPDARVSVSAAESAYDDAVRRWTNLRDSCGVRNALNGLAHFQIAMGRYEAARASAQQALDQTCQDVVAKAHSLRVLQSAVEWLGDLDETIRTGEQALSIYVGTGDLVNQDLILGNLSAAYVQEGATGEGLEAAKKALDLARLTGDEEGVIFDEETIGGIYSLRGEYQLALDMFHHTLDELHTYPDSDVEGMVEDDLGDVYSALGDRKNALASFKLAQATASTHQNPSILLDSLIDEGNHYLSRQQYADADKVYQRALDVSNQKQIAPKRLKAERGLGAAEIGLGHVDSGMARLSAVRDLARSSHDYSTEIDADISLGDYYFGRDDWAKAADWYGQSRDLARLSHARPPLTVAWASLARVHEASDDLPAAQSNAEEALAIIEEQGTLVNEPDLQSSFFESTRSYYDLYIQILMGRAAASSDEAYTRAALQAAENSRARALTNLLSERAITVQRPVSEDLLRQRSQAKDALQAAAYHIDRLPSSASRQEREAAQASIEGARHKLNQAEGAIRAANRRYSDLTRPAPLSVDEVQQKLLDSNTVLLEYWLSEKESYLWEVTADEIHSYRLPAGKRLDRLASRLRLLLASWPELPAGVSLQQKADYDAKRSAEINGLSSSLGRILLQPVSSHLGHRNVVIVADGSLRGIPFGILPTNANVALEQRNAITYLPSAGSLRWIRKENDRLTANSQVTVFADPVFDRNDPRLAVHENDLPLADAAVTHALRDANTQRLSRLVWSRLEARSIASDVPVNRQWLALDFAANRNSVVQASWPSDGIIHFATHAVIDFKNPELSGVVLSLYDKQGHPIDGFLRVTDIYNLSIPAHLVVLSTCNSAVEAAAPGEDAYSLANAFFYAGTPRVLVSLWTVNDEAAATFMARFYRALLVRHGSAAVALRSAKQDMSVDPRWHAPYYWSGFELDGDWR